ncbi:YcnI family protein [Streptomyces sp. JH002]|uniref:YcnI family copper-binding membrane protein n=1 Tax=Streptomyces sp. JH002 TaxID=2763259 RepID=UPI003D807FB8
MHRTRVAARAATLLLTATGVLALAGTAQAHVSVDPGEAGQGGYSVVNFKVPNERADASTVRLEIHLDPAYPLSSVMPQPVPGWDVEIETAPLDEPLDHHGSQITEAPSVITWSGGEIAPGTFQQFPVSLGPLPGDTDQLVFKAIQTYDSDEVVRWIEEPAADGTEPEYPAAVLRLTPATDGGHGHGAPESGAGEAGHDGTESVVAEAASASDTTARVLAGAGLATGIAGIAIGVLAGRRRATPADPQS